MPKRLTVPEQRRLIRTLPAHRRALVRKECQRCQMRGSGIMDILKSAGKALGHLGKEIGPVVLKELVLPMLKKKYLDGKGLNPAGGTLRLAGQGRKGRAKPRTKKTVKRRR